MTKIKAYGIALYKKQNNTIKLLLCKSIASTTRWGFLKGVEDINDGIPKQTAQREFYEESGIYVDIRLLNKYFYQQNEFKDIGIYLVDANDIPKIDKYFKKDKLLQKYICNENSNVEYFDITNLPKFKKKQEILLNNILKYIIK